MPNALEMINAAYAANNLTAQIGAASETAMNLNAGNFNPAGDHAVSSGAETVAAEFTAPGLA